MAKDRKKLRGDSDVFDLDGLDLGGFDDDFGFGDDAKKKGPIRNFTSSFARGFLKGMESKKLLKGVIRTALPDGYSRAFKAAEEVSKSVREMGSELKQSNASDFLTIAKRAESVLPKLKGKTSERLYGKIESQVKAIQDNLQSEIDSQRSASTTAPSVDKDSEAVSAIMAELAVVQGRTAIAKEAADSTRFEIERTERGIRDHVTGMRFDFMSRQIGQIADDVNRQTAYQDQITYKFQQKSLEAQYRSLFMLRDIREATLKTLETHHTAYDAIIHNTALPDHVKSEQSEKIRFNAKESLGSRMGSHVRDNLPVFLANYFPTIRENIMRRAKSTLSSVGSGLREMESMSGMMDMPGLSKAEMAGEMGGEWLGDGFSDLLIPMLADSIQPGWEALHGHISKKDHPLAGLVKRLSPRARRVTDFAVGQGDRMSYLLQNMPATLRDFSNDLSMSRGWRGQLQQLVRSFAPSYFLDDSIQDGSYQTIDRQAAFNQMTQRSIVEIIPGYLSRILHETRMARTGDETAEREVYDITKGQFTGYKAASKSMLSRVVPEMEIQRLSSILDQVIEGYDTEGKLSDDAKKALRHRLLRDASRGGRFDPSSYAFGGYASGTDNRTVEELRNFFEGQFQFDEKGRMVGNRDNYRRRREMGDLFRELQGITPDPRDELRRLSGTGAHGMLRDLGLIETSYGSDRINYEKIWSIYSGSDEPYVADSINRPELVGPVLPSAMERMAWRARSKAKEGINKLRKRSQPHVSKLKGRAGRSYKKAKDAATPHVEELLHKAQTEVDRLRDAVPEHFDKARQASNEKLEELKKQAGEQGRRIKDTVDKFTEDICFDDSGRKIALKAKDLAAGLYVDVKSGKIIKSLKDITGEIVDREGMTVVTDEEAERGLFTRSGIRIDMPLLKERANKAKQSVEDKIDQVRHTAQARIKDFDTVEDLYTKNQESVVLLARDIRRGRYIDTNSGRVIKSRRDITGEVKDIDGNIVLTAEEFEQGLYDIKGTNVVAGTSAFLSKAGRLIYNPVATIGGMLGRGIARVGRAIGSGVSRIWDRMTRPMDLYIGDEENPRIRAALLKSGQYVDGKTGDPISNYDQIKGQVRDIDGNVVLEASEIPRAVTASREKHPLAKKPGLIRRILGGTLRTAGRAAGWYGRKIIKPYYKWLGKKVLPKWLTGGDANARLPKEAEGMTPTDSILSRILGVLDARLPGKKPRKGSWEEILSRRKQKEEDANRPDHGGSAADGMGLFGKAGAGLAGLWSLIRGNRDDEEGEEDDGGGFLSTAAEYLGMQAAYDKAKGWWGKRKGGKTPRGGKAKNWASRVRAIKAGGKAGLLARSTPWLARGGVALASVLSGPVVIGGAALAAASVGGYMYYQRRKKVSGLFRELRMTQYGFSPNGWSKPGSIMELEQLWEQITYRKEGEEPKVDYARLDMPRIYKIFGIGNSDIEQAEGMVEWMTHRFRPIYLTYQAALSNLAPQVNLSEIDEKLPKELGMELLELVTAFPYEGDDSPYSILTSPFKAGAQITIKEKHIRQRIRQIEHAYKKKARTEEEREAAASGVDQAAKEAAQVVTEAVRTSGQEAGVQFRDTSAGGESIFDPLTGGLASDAATKIVSNALALKGYIDRELTVLETIRLKAYGLDRFTTKDVTRRLNLEEVVLKHVTIGSDGRAVFNGSAGDVLDEVRAAFGIPSGHSTLAKSWTLWFNNRFLPVFLNFISASSRASSSISVTSSPARIERQLNPVQKALVGEAIMSSSSINGASSISVWQLGNDNYQPWVGNDLRAIEESARGYLNLLNAEADNYEVKTQQIATRSQEAAKAAVTGVPMNTPRSQGIGPGRPFSVTGGITGGGAGSSSAMSPSTISSSPAKDIALGNVFGSVMSGTGGVWESIPFPTANRSSAAASVTMRAVGMMVGIDPSILLTFANIESSLDYRARNDKSTATGWFQFIDKTWDEVYAKYASKYGLPDRDEGRALRLDPRVNALMGALFLKENHAILSQKLGRVPTDTDLYLAHFFGPTGAVKFLEADVNAVAYRVFPQAALANRAIFYTGGGRPRSIGDVYRLMDERVNRYRLGDVGVSLASSANADVDVAAANDGAYQETTAMGAANNEPYKLPTTMGRMALTTVNPLNTGPTQSPAARPASMTMVSTSGGADVSPSADPVIAAQEAQRMRAEAMDRRQQQQVEHSMVSSQQVHTTMSKQLKVQEEMRDYLKYLASNLGAQIESNKNTEDGQRRPNDTSRPPQTASLGTMRTKPPISMRDA